MNRTSIENNLRTLKIDHVSLVHFRALPGVSAPFEQSMEAMFDLKREGNILHLGVSNVTLAEFELALKMGAIATGETPSGLSYTSKIA